MGAPQYEQAGADIGGTGTTNTIPRWTGPSTLGDSAMVQSAAAITVSLPQFALGVTGSGTGGGYRVVDDTGTSRFLMGFVGVAGAKDWSLYDLANSAYRVVVVGTGAGAGNVGIGTASPDTNLSILRTSGGLFPSSGTTPTNAALRLKASAANAMFAGVDTASPFGAWIQVADTTNLSLTYPLLLNPNGGNVGIGTASPSSRLDVAGTITCDDAGTGLKLPATPGNADTQTLDAYQEGTVTATITTTTGTVTLVASLNTLRYTRIGRMVNVQGYLEVQSVTGPPTGDFVINGLPATIGTGSQSGVAAAVWTNNMAAGYTGTAVAVTLPGTTTLSIRRITTAGVNATDFGTYTQAGTAISISIWYSV